MRFIHLVALGLAFAIATPAPTFAKDNTATQKAGKTAKAKKLKGVTGAATGGVAEGGVMELTAQECKGVGGRVGDPAPDMSCPTTGQACFTTDKHGVIRAACIDEVAPD